MSEFYSQRRTSTKDGVGLVGFIFGWFAAAPFAWPYIADGFDGGDPAMGVLRFVLVVFAVGIAAGAGGLLLGAGAGLAWERTHRWRRGSRVAPAIVDSPASVREEPRPVTLHAPPPLLRFEVGGVNADEYVSLATRTTSDRHDATRAVAALARTLNIGAWDGDRLVGVARVLTDGHYYAALADIVVDREYQRRGIGRELMNKAFDATPRGSLSIVARPGSTAFFERIGCELGGGYAGFTMRHSSR